MNKGGALFFERAFNNMPLRRPFQPRYNPAILFASCSWRHHYVTRHYGT